MGLQEYIRDLKNASQLIRRSDEVTLIHHNDADGLTSAAILIKALEREGKGYENIAIERVHPKIIERIVEKYDTLLIFVDLGAGAAPIISKINNGKNKIIILDHHRPTKVTDPHILLLATSLYGISGEREITASGAAYLLASTLNNANTDLAYLATIGVIGDSHHKLGELRGIDRQVLEKSVSLGQVDVKIEDDKRRYVLRVFNEEQDIEWLAKALTTLGAVGYLLKGPDIAIKALLRGFDSEFWNLLNKLDRIKRSAFDKVINKLINEGLNQSKYVQWVHVYNEFYPMGVKVIGEFCMEIKDMKFINQLKYLAGFQNMPKEVPKLGKFDWNIVKVSFRLPKLLERKVFNDEMPGYDYIIPRVARHIECVVDACHKHSCATTLNIGSEEKLIKYIDACVEEYVEKVQGV